MNKFHLLLILIFLTKLILAQTILTEVKGDYLGQKPPSDSAIIFAPGIVSVQDRYEYGLAISTSFDEIYFTAEGAPDSLELSGLLRIRKEGNTWLKPELANLNKQDLWEQEAFFTPNGEKLFYAVSDTNSTKIWFSSKIENGWSKGQLLNSPINESANRLFYNTFNNNQDLYYTNVDEFQIYKAEFNNGSYSNFVKLDLPRAGHGFVAPDESFIIIDSRLNKNYGKLDIYVSFKQANGTWGAPINLGPKVNTEYSETCPSLSPDGKFIFFGRYNEKNEKSDIYWISAEILKSLKTE